MIGSDSMSPMRAISMLTTCTILVAFGAVLLQAYFESAELSRMTTIASGLVRLEMDPAVQVQKQQQPDGSGPPRVAVAYGSCNDIYASVQVFLNQTGDGRATQPESGGGGDDITNEAELLRSFAYYFERGAAAERYTSNTTMFRQLVQRLLDSGQVRSDLGGNAPVMGRRFHLEGADVLIGAEMSAELRYKLPATVQLTGGQPANAYDDIHLIIEYKTNDRWGPLTAPRANRFILHNDFNNPQLTSLPAFGASLAQFDPRLLVIAGLQMLDSYPFAATATDRQPRQRLMRSVAAQMRAQLPRSHTLIHAELASYTDYHFVELVVTEVVRHADSLGMNEQELDTLVQYTRGDRFARSRQWASDSNPRVGDTLQKMRELLTYLRNSERGEADELVRETSRLHVHTLAFQAIMVVADSGWRNTRAAAAKASLTAFRTVCRSTVVNPQSAQLLLDDSFSVGGGGGGEQPTRMYLNGSEPVACWTERLGRMDGAAAVELEVCVAPVLVCRVARQTAGAGDNISAAGLILQI